MPKKEIYLGEIPEGTKRCLVCAEPINAASRKCVHCGADQNPLRQRLGFSTNFLSMAVALVSVLGVVVPVLIQSATPDNSHLIFSLQYATDSELFVIVSNQGREPGTVSLARLQVKGGKSVELRSSERAPVLIVEPKKTELLHFHKFILEGQRVKFDAVFEAQPDQSCVLALEVTSFRGEHLRPKVEHPCREFFPFIHDPSKPVPRAPGATGSGG
jgi:predicted nucleic acid-binding Zn ribbon protein